MIKVNIGCGFRYDGSESSMLDPEDKDCIKGFIGIDKGDYGQHYVRDLRRGLPFADNSIDYINADSVLEHIPYAEHFGEDDFVFIMNECLRVLKIGSEMRIIVPMWSSEVMAKDITHCRSFSPKSWSYLECENTWEYGFVKGWRVIKTERIVKQGDILEVILKKEK